VCWSQIKSLGKRIKVAIEQEHCVLKAEFLSVMVMRDESIFFVSFFATSGLQQQHAKYDNDHLRN